MITPVSSSSCIADVMNRIILQSAMHRHNVIIFTANHDILIYKLSIYGIKITVLRWF